VDARPPKPLIGYSDLTALHLLRDRWGLPGLHAPMPGSDGLKAPDDWARLSEALRQGWHAGDLLAPPTAHIRSTGPASPVAG
jgi:muramoyltetrapeptide carboxypeptidase